jgi:hypothetical protein
MIHIYRLKFIPWFVSAMLLFVSTTLIGSSVSVDFDPSYENIIDGYILPRLHRFKAEPHYADKVELMYRMSLDLTGTVPSPEDKLNLLETTTQEMAEYFLNKEAFIRMSQMVYADLFMYSNDNMFSTDEQIASFNELVAQLHLGEIAFDEFARQVIVHPAYLSRFTSSIDRATVAFEVFLGYTPITTYDFEYANMFNGYQLSDNGERVYTLTGNCDDPNTDETESCLGTIWGMSGVNPTDAGNMLTGLHAFSERGAELLWHRYIGAAPEAVFPEIIVALGEHFAEINYDIRELTLLIITSAAYTQSNRYRDDDLVL